MQCTRCNPLTRNLMPGEFVVDPGDLPGPVVACPSWVQEAGFSLLGDWAGPLDAPRR